MQVVLIFSRECKEKILKEGWEEVENIWSILIKYDSPRERELDERLKRAVLASSKYTRVRN